MTEMPGGAREWKRVSASGVSTTWSLCWHKRSSMCAIRTTRVSVGQSMKAHGSSGWLVEATGCIGVPPLDSMAADEGRPLCGVVVMSRDGGRYGAMCGVGWQEDELDERLKIDLLFSKEVMERAQEVTETETDAKREKGGARDV